MNPANFSHVGGGGIPGVPNPHGQMQPQKGDSMNNQLVFKVGQALRSQGPFTGWRAQVPDRDRAMKVLQMISSLRLIQPRVDLQNAVQAALTFEEKAFREANQKEDYEKECTNKLLAIRDTRLRQQAAVMQSGMMQQAGAAGGMPGVRPNQMQPQFAPQMTRPMQTSPIPVQQPMGMGMNNPNQQATLQQQQQQQPQHQQAQHRPAAGMAAGDDLSMLTPQEFEQVSRMAEQILNNRSREDLEKIKMNVQRSLTPEQKQMLAQKNMDPLVWFLRTQALKQLRMRRSRMEMARANAAMMGGDPMMNSAQRQMVPNMMGLQRNSALPMNGQQNLDPASFMGNVENIQGQQADGLRSQEAGQLVVPASNSQMNPQQFASSQGMFPGGAQQQLVQNGQPNTSRPGVNPQQFLAQQHLQNAQSIQQERIQQAAQFQAQSQAQAQAQIQARAQAVHNAKMVITTQAGSQASSQVPQTLPQQSPAMPMLNRPMGPQMSPAQTASQGRPPSRPPGMAGQQPGGQQSTMQARPQIPPNLPPTVQERLSQMTPEQINAFLINHQRRLLANSQAMARANGQQSMPMQPTMSQPGQNGQLVSDQNMRASLALQQSLSGMGGAQPQNPLLQGQQMSLQQQQQQGQRSQQQHNEFIKQQDMRSQMDITQKQIREMDRVPFPPQILNSNANMNPPVPKTVKTWGQLKQWVAQNPQVLGNVDLSRLLELQRLHLAQTMAQAGRNSDQNGPLNSLGLAQPFMPPQNFRPGQPQQQQHPPINIPAMRPVTAQDIQAARQQLRPEAQNFTDEQLRDLIQKHRQRQIMQQAHNRAASQAAAAQAMNQSQQSQQPSHPQQPAAPQNPAQPKQPPSSQPPPQTPQSNQQAQTAQAGGANAQAQGAIAAGKNTKAAAAKTTSKKRPHGDEAVDVQNSKTQPASQPLTTQPSTTATAPARPPLPFTREQLAAMTPQQRAQLEAQMRRQQRPQIKKAAAEEAWNHLPDKLKHLYTEMAKNTPAPEAVTVSPEDKATMARQLWESTDMLGRLDTLVQWLAKIPGQEKNVKVLFSMRIQLMRQFKDTDWSLNDQFSIAPEYLRKSIAYIKGLFAAMISRVQNQQQSQRPGGAAAQPPSGQPTMTPLNATNLQALQQQEEALQRARRAQNQAVPAAPTVAQPPFPLGAPSPQGVPHAYGPGGFSPDKLKLPPSKRRKQSHAGATTTPTTPGPGAQAKPEASKPSDVEVKSFTCSVPECEYHSKGFPSQAALDKHIEESHKAEEQIEDPLQYALDSFKSALVEPAKEKEKSEAKATSKPPAAVDVQRAAAKSATGPNVKQEIKAEGATPATAGTTPMGRVSSQAAPKSVSPASNQLPTPRMGGAGKAPSNRPTPGKDSKKESERASDQTVTSEDVQLKDGWVDSTVSLDLISEVFDSARNEDYCGLRGDPFDEFLNADMFTLAQAEDTPDSVDSGGAVTQTPKDGDLSREDVVIKIGGPEDDNWIPADWFSHPGPLGDRMFIDDPWVDIDWEALERKEADPIGGDDGGLTFVSS